MKSIFLVRHGQASIHSDNYDQLSSLGEQQSQMLGHYLGQQERTWDRVLIGPLNRHQQTYQAFAEGYAHFSELPKVEVCDGLREHEAIRVVDHVLAGNDRTTQTSNSADDELQFFRRFDKVMRDWVDQRLTLPDGWETWQQARRRAAATLDGIRQRYHKEKVIAFTSGGFVAMAVGEVLDLSDSKVYEMSLEVANSSWTELRHAFDALRLRHFNWHPHLTDANSVTLV